MILSHKHRFIFLCNGRTGTTSIERSLADLDEGRDYVFDAKHLFVAKHIPPAILRGCVPARVWDDYFKFVFVRNPYDWLVSQWQHNFKLRRIPRDARVKVDWAELTPDRKLLVMGRPVEKLAATEVFSCDDIEFLYRFLKQNFKALPYAPASLQSSYVFDADGQKMVDFVGRYERLAEDYATILERLGLQRALPHLNITKRGPFRGYFTPESAALVTRLWATDFETLGYSTCLDE